MRAMSWGLLVWEEIPGWQYLGDATLEGTGRPRCEKRWSRRDRNHPAIVIWGVRINESANDPHLPADERDCQIA